MDGLKPKKVKAQSTAEYMILLGVITALILLGWDRYFYQTAVRAGSYYNKAANGIMDDRPVPRRSLNNYP